MGVKMNYNELRYSNLELMTNNELDNLYREAQERQDGQFIKKIKQEWNRRVIYDY